MPDLDVRIVKLEPMRVASAYGFGPEPEPIAVEKMRAFLEARGMLEGYGTAHPSYGFNNPGPAAGRPEYGYEIWVPVADEVRPEADVRIGQFHGGPYAVTRCEGLGNIGTVWDELHQWGRASPHGSGYHQWLENLHNPLESNLSKYVFDLYLPIAA